MSTITRISPAEAQEKLAQGYTYVDVRSEQEFAELVMDDWGWKRQWGATTSSYLAMEQ